MIEKLANAVQSVADKIASWPEAMSWQEDVKRYRKNASFFRNAPVCIGVFSGVYQSPMDKVLVARESFDREAKEILGFRRSAPTAVQSVSSCRDNNASRFSTNGFRCGLVSLTHSGEKRNRSDLKSPIEYGSHLPDRGGVSRRIATERKKACRGGIRICLLTLMGIQL